MLITLIIVIDCPLVVEKRVCFFLKTRRIRVVTCNPVGWLNKQYEKIVTLELSFINAVADFTVTYTGSLKKINEWGSLLYWLKSRTTPQFSREFGNTVPLLSVLHHMYTRYIL